ncbi:phage tail spike protein [Listeria monocytogenes]|uniref:phage tail spike protein n=1 Tax=Listeria monocytogenes TaxID=1639 RepID=UPI0008738A28|nr:phage tail spike protein [Listeria monocytogenes]EAC7998111.1 hypothetical protein [Listeria monocytogenes]EAC8350556.1 hypothetical protein [Listeria monocytogenes]EAD0739946.1 hypothetical protein [Listeria monocytogenes]EAD9140307.1 hypothetical protein [Listeria monocytogenes]EIL9239374.1 phage tail protein [Listeria monocytogenes]
MRKRLKHIYLFDSKDTVFTSNGLGALIDFYDEPVVKEEINGEFSFAGTYKIDGQLAKLIKDGMLLKVYCSDRTWQMFRISRPTRNIPLMTIDIFAYHISYDVNRNFIENFFESNGSGSKIMAGLQQAQTFTQAFKFSSDVVTTHQFTANEVNPIDALIGSNNGIQNLTGVTSGELQRDNYNLRLKTRLGEDRGFRIDLGINLNSIKETIDDSSVINSLYLIGATPEGAYDSNSKPITFKYLETPGLTNETRIIGKRTNSECKTIDELKKWGQSLFDKDRIHEVKVVHEVDMEDLSQYEEYEHLTALTELTIGDTVYVNGREFIGAISERVVSTEWSPRTANYKKLVLGNDFDLYTLSQNETVQKQVSEMNRITNDYIKRIKSATELITGQSGGHVIFRPKNKPSEILIMDTDDVNTAKKVWRWNLGGLGYSSTGVNGSYGTAITQDGQIVADFITVGTLEAGLIKTGFNNIGEVIQIANNALVVYNGTHKLIELTKTGMHFWNNSGSEVGLIGVSGKIDIPFVSGYGDDYTGRGVFIDGKQKVLQIAQGKSVFQMWDNGTINSYTPGALGWIQYGGFSAGAYNGDKSIPCFIAGDSAVYVTGKLIVNGKEIK